MAKVKKARAVKYDKKLAIDGTFEELIKVSVNYNPSRQTTRPKKQQRALPKKPQKKKQ